MESRVYRYWNIMKKHPELPVLFLTFVVFLGIYWKGTHGGLSTKPAEIPTKFVGEPFKDIYYGGLNYRDVLISESLVSVAFYYAPWSLDSVNAAKEFSNVTSHLSKQISWIAVNCWWSRGECRGSTNIEHFPQVYLHHKLLDKPIQPIHYEGPLQKKYFEQFLNKVFQPIRYLTSKKEIQEFITKNKLPVIGYFGNQFYPANIPFQIYFQTSLINLNQFPDDDIVFGIITNHRLSFYLGFNQNNVGVYSNEILVKKINVTNNITANSVLNWVNKNKGKFEQDILLKYSSTEKSNEIYLTMKKGPTLIAFLNQTDHINILKEIATRYKSIKFQNCRCISKKCHICILGSFPLYNWAVMMSSIQCGRSCMHMTSHFNLQRYEVCCNLENEDQSIEGLYWRTNRTLRFIVLDSDNHVVISKQFSLLDHNGIIIVDGDDYFKMNSKISVRNLENFILEYTYGALTYSSNILNTQTSNFVNSISNISVVDSTNFEQKILQSGKDSLVYYHSSSCGFCSTSSHAFLQLLQYFGDNNVLQLFVVDHELPQLYDTYIYPNLILFLGNRTMNSVAYPQHLPYSKSNIIRFLLRHSSPSTKAFIVLQFCNQLNQEEKFYEICKMKEQLKRLAVT